MHGLSLSQTRRHMINEVFVLEIDKNGQFLALVFGCVEIFFFFFFPKTLSVGWFVLVPVNNYVHGERLTISFRQ